jgi:hypothetical protein
MKQKNPKPQFVAFTPKAQYVEALRAEGKGFGEALEIADREFSADGMQFNELKSIASHWLQPRAALASQG